MVFKIAGCAGHGFNTPGKRTPDDEREWSFNNEVILAFEEALKQYEDVEFLRTDDRTGKIDVPLKTRTDKANTWGADIYISFHHNANTSKWGNWTGTEAFYREGSKEGLKLVEIVHPLVLKAYGLRDRGLKTENLHITRETHMPAILLEGGFMDSTIDIIKLRDHNVLKTAGYAVAEGVAEYAGLKKKVTLPQAPKTNPIKKIVQKIIKPKATYHVVVKGDTLSELAVKYKTTVANLKKLNRLKSDVIKLGKKLRVK